MQRAYSLSDFVAEMQSLIDRGATTENILEAGERRLRRAIRNPRIIPARYRRPLGTGPKANHGTYNLYRGRGLFISASVWGPGDHSDPHNHGTWGLIGVLENAMQETRYRATGTDSRGLPKVERETARLVQQGEVVRLLPGSDEIHELDNFSQVSTSEIHVYGANLIGLDRWFFDRTTGLARPFRSGPYDNC